MEILGFLEGRAAIGSTILPSPGNSCRCPAVNNSLVCPHWVPRVRRTAKALRQEHEMSRPLIIAPSILAADFARLGEEVRAVDAGRRRLDPCRCHGRPFRAQHLHRPGHRQGDPALHQKAARRASDDRAVRSLSRSLRQGRRRHHHRACRSGTAHPPLAAGDPRARQEGRRHAQSRHAGSDHRAGDRARRSRFS